MYSRRDLPALDTSRAVEASASLQHRNNRKHRSASTRMTQVSCSNKQQHMSNPCLQSTACCWQPLYMEHPLRSGTTNLLRSAQKSLQRCAHLAVARRKRPRGPAGQEPLLRTSLLMTSGGALNYLESSRWPKEIAKCCVLGGLSTPFSPLAPQATSQGYQRGYYHGATGRRPWPTAVNVAFARNGYGQCNQHLLEECN